MFHATRVEESTCRLVLKINYSGCSANEYIPSWLAQ